MKIGIITAMDKEFQQVTGVIRNPRTVEIGIFSFICGSAGKNEIILAKSGIGKVNAALGAAALIKAFTPECIVSTGVAGGLDTGLSVMDVVAATEVAYHDVDCGPGNVYGQIQGLPPRFTCDAHLLKSAEKLMVNTKIHFGLTVSGDKFVSAKEELERIKHIFPESLAVDMESGAIAQTCHLYSLPFLSFRIISDVPGGNSHYADYQDFWGEMANRSFAVTRTFIETADI